jgi:hypothetical protein
MHRLSLISIDRDSSFEAGGMTSWWVGLSLVALSGGGLFIRNQRRHEQG